MKSFKELRYEAAKKYCDKRYHEGCICADFEAGADWYYAEAKKELEEVKQHCELLREGFKMETLDAVQKELAALKEENEIAMATMAQVHETNKILEKQIDDLTVENKSILNTKLYSRRKLEEKVEDYERTLVEFPCNCKGDQDHPHFSVCDRCEVLKKWTIYKVASRRSETYQQRLKQTLKKIEEELMSMSPEELAETLGALGDVGQLYLLTQKSRQTPKMKKKKK